jgi:hypothetical protein
MQLTILANIKAFNQVNSNPMPPITYIELIERRKIFNKVEGIPTINIYEI